MFCAMVSRKRVSAWRCRAIEPMPGVDLIAVNSSSCCCTVVGDVHAGQPRPIHHLVERIDIHEGGKAEVALDDVGHRDLADAAPPLEELHLDEVTAPQVQELRHPLVDHEPDARQRRRAGHRDRGRGRGPCPGLADDGELARQVAVARRTATDL